MQILFSRLSGRQFFLHAPCCNLFDRLAGGESLLHAPCWNLSVARWVGSLILHAPSRHLSRLSSGAESLTRPVLQSVSSLSRSGVSLSDRTCLSGLRVRSLYNTPRAEICLVVRRVGSLLHAPCSNLSRLSPGGESLTRPMLQSVTSFVGWGDSL